MGGSMSDLEWLTKKQALDCPRYPFTSGQLNFYLLNRHKNGLHIAVRKIGKSLYLRRDLFEQWIEDQQSKKNK